MAYGKNITKHKNHTDRNTKTNFQKTNKAILYLVSSMSVKRLWKTTQSKYLQSNKISHANTGQHMKKKNPHNVNLAKRAYRNWNITIQDVNTGNVSSNKEGANSSKFQCHMWNSSIQQHSKCVKAICLLPYVVPLSWHSSAWALWNGTINLSLIQESRTNPMCFSLKKQCGFKGKVISKPVDYNTK